MQVFKNIVLKVISWYQRSISSRRQKRVCKYEPTCSHYAYSSIEIHGIFKGSLLSIWRILRCNPFSNGGVDRVPKKGKWPRKPLTHSELLKLYEEEDSNLSD